MQSDLDRLSPSVAASGRVSSGTFSRDSGACAGQASENASLRVGTGDRADRTGVAGLAVRWLGFLGIGAALGCAAPGGLEKDASPQAKQDLVARRAVARWDALIKRDMDSAYAFLSPASREVISLAGYKTKIKPGRWRAAKVESVTCDVEICDVKLTIGYDFRNAARTERFETPLEEKWLIDKGNAWYVYRN